MKSNALAVLDAMSSGVDEDGARSDIARALIADGDARLDIDAGTGLNRYGCSAAPRPVAASFSATTASSISARGFARAGAALEDWSRAARRGDPWAALDRQVELLREELCDLLGVCISDVDMVFSPSGTDSQIHALAVAQAALGGPMTTIVVGSDQTGSGTAFTAAGRHFADRTAHGAAVRQGRPVAGLEASQSVPIALHGPAGPRPIGEIDAAVLAAVDTAHRAGRTVLVQAMNASKLGRRAPSDACLDLVRDRGGGTVRIVVDACQMRLGLPRLRRHLDLGDMVLVTGSKFFTGPPFSGALLVPSRRRTLSPLAPGLGAYASRQDWPSSRKAIRDALPPRLALGPWLRWEAAMADMGAYAAVPLWFREEALRRFGHVATVLAASDPFHLVESRNGERCGEDAEFATPTIVPFLIRAGSGWISPIRVAELYAALNRGAAGRAIHLGQPVRLSIDGQETAALRVSADARSVSDGWSPDRAEAERRLARQAATLGNAFEALARLASTPAS